MNSAREILGAIGCRLPLPAKVPSEGDLGHVECECCGAALGRTEDGSPWHLPDEDCRAVRTGNARGAW